MVFLFDCPVCWHKTNMPQTNADRIRAMSDEELAAKISGRCISDIVCGGNCKAFATLDKTSQQQCVEIVLDWLKQPAEEDDHREAYTTKVRSQDE